MPGRVPYELFDQLEEELAIPREKDSAHRCWAIWSHFRRKWTGDMTKGDYLAVAKQYEAAREDLRRAFESMPQEEQAEGKVVVRRLRAKDEERMQLQRGVS